VENYPNTNARILGAVSLLATTNVLLETRKVPVLGTHPLPITITIKINATGLDALKTKNANNNKK
jgi:hypothetical protein